MCAHVPGLGPVPRPLDDLRALVALMRHVRRFRPDIVHTHTAKAGILGRLAARLALGRAPIVIHTYHGHVLRGYFGPRTEAVYRLLERVLGRLSTRLIGVSPATVDELVALRVAPRRQFAALPIGLDLDRFLAVGPAADGLRGALGAGPDTLVATFVGRLVPIKRVDLLIDAVKLARARGADVAAGDRRRWGAAGERWRPKPPRSATRWRSLGSAMTSSRSRPPPTSPC